MKRESDRRGFLYTVSCMEKVFADRPVPFEETSGVTLKNRKHCFQLVVENSDSWYSCENRVEIESTLKEYIALQMVDNVPAASVSKNDDYYLGEAGLYPDVIRPFKNGDIMLPAMRKVAVWVSVEGKEGLPVGKHDIHFTLFDEKGKRIDDISYCLEVLDGESERCPLVKTNWMHYDSICQQYGVQPFTKEFYKIFDWYLRAYVQGGWNMLYTPLFTPPLDTAVGGECMTTQLISIVKENGEYRFDFSLLKEFLSFSFERGVEYIEFSHLFTQWGGEHCPKIVATVDGEEKRIFGWESDSHGAEYTAFLDAFLPKLVAFIRSEGIEDRCYFHLTDEPSAKHIQSYEQCRDAVKKHIGNMPTMDALSNVEYSEKGLVDVPVPTTDSVRAFVQKRGSGKGLIAYYSGTPAPYYSNRSIHMPLQRTRVIGSQLYLNGVDGFLHWGFNFYATGFSYYPIDPYAVTDCMIFGGGGGFIVYPRTDGVNISLRYEAMRMAFEDCDALYTLERKIGREKVVELLQEAGFDGFDVYRKSARRHALFREKIDRMIAKNE